MLQGFFHSVRPVKPLKRLVAGSGCYSPRSADRCKSLNMISSANSSGDKPWPIGGPVDSASGPSAKPELFAHHLRLLETRTSMPRLGRLAHTIEPHSAIRQTQVRPRHQLTPACHHISQVAPVAHRTARSLKQSLELMRLMVEFLLSCFYLLAVRLSGALFVWHSSQEKASPRSELWASILMLVATSFRPLSRARTRD